MNSINEILIPIMERLERIESKINQNDSPSLMTVKDVAEYSRLSKATMTRGLRKGTLKPFKDEGKKLFRKSDVDAWLRGK